MLSDVSAATARRSGFLTRARTSAGHVYFGLCMGSLAFGFVLFYAFFKYKLVLFGWLVCVGLFAVFWIARSIRFRLDVRVLLPVLAFQGWLWLTAAWSYDPRQTLWWLALDSLLPVVFLLAISWAQNVTAWRLSWYFEMTAVLYSLLGLWFLVTTGGFVDDRFGAVRSGMAAALLTAVPFLFWRLRLRANPYRAALTVWTVLSLLAVGSRSALVLLPVALLGGVWIAVRTNRRPLSTAFIAALATLVVAGALLAVPAVRAGLAEGLARFSPAHQSLDVSAKVVSELGRSEAVDIDRRLQAFVALETFLADPALGDGYMNTYMKVQDRFQREVSAHGLPFTLLAETGLVGTVLFLLMVASCYRALRRAAQGAASLRERGFMLTLTLTLTVLLLFGLFHQVHQNPTFHVLLGWGYAVAIAARPPRTAASPHPAHRAPAAGAPA